MKNNVTTNKHAGMLRVFVVATLMLLFAAAGVGAVSADAAGSMDGASFLQTAQNGVITLTDDVVLSSTATVSKDTLVINLGGHTLTSVDGTLLPDGTIKITGSAAVTINGPGLVTGGTRTDPSSYNNEPKTIYMEGSSELTVNSATVNGSKGINTKYAGHAIESSSTGKITIQNAEINGGECEKKGVTLETRETFNYKYQGYGGRALKVNKGSSVSISTSKIHGGYGSATDDTSIAYVDGGTNQAYGGVAISLSSAANLTLVDSTVIGGNSDVYNAGEAISAGSCDVSIQNSTVTGGSCLLNSPSYGIAGAGISAGAAHITISEHSKIAGGGFGNSWVGAGIELSNWDGVYLVVTDSEIRGGSPGSKSGNGYGNAIYPGSWREPIKHDITLGNVIISAEGVSYGLVANEDSSSYHTPIKVSGPLTVDKKSGKMLKLADLTIDAADADDFVLKTPALIEDADSVNFNVPEGYCLSVPTAKTGEYYEYTLVKAVAKIGDEMYFTLADAVNNATGGTKDEPVVIEIIKDIKLDKSVSVNKNNVTIDGNYHNISVSDAESWDKYKVGGDKQKYGSYNLITVSGENVLLKNVTLNVGDCRGVSAATTKGGSNVTYENITYTGRGSGHYYGYGNSGTIWFKNCTVNTHGYGIHCSLEGSATTLGFDVVIDGCTIHGWNSFGDLTKLTIKDTKFDYANDEGKNGNLAVLRPYCPTVVDNCVFTEMFAGTGAEDDFRFIDSGDNTTIEFNNCIVVDNLESLKPSTNYKLQDIIVLYDEKEGSKSVFAIDALKDKNGKFVAGLFVSHETDLTEHLSDGYHPIKQDEGGKLWTVYQDMPIKGPSNSTQGVESQYSTDAITTVQGVSYVWKVDGAEFSGDSSTSFKYTFASTGEKVITVSAMKGSTLVGYGTKTVTVTAPKPLPKEEEAVDVKPNQEEKADPEKVVSSIVTYNKDAQKAVIPGVEITSLVFGEDDIKTMIDVPSLSTEKAIKIKVSDHTDKVETGSSETKAEEYAKVIPNVADDGVKKVLNVEVKMVTLETTMTGETNLVDEEIVHDLHQTATFTFSVTLDRKLTSADKLVAYRFGDGVEAQQLETTYAYNAAASTADAFVYDCTVYSPGFSNIAVAVITNSNDGTATYAVNLPYPLNPDERTVSILPGEDLVIPINLTLKKAEGSTGAAITGWEINVDVVNTSGSVGKDTCRYTWAFNNSIDNNIMTSINGKDTRIFDVIGATTVKADVSYDNLFTVTVGNTANLVAGGEYTAKVTINAFQNIKGDENTKKYTPVTLEVPFILTDRVLAEGSNIYATKDLNIRTDKFGNGLWSTFNESIVTIITMPVSFTTNIDWPVVQRNETSADKIELSQYVVMKTDVAFDPAKPENKNYDWVDAEGSTVEKDASGKVVINVADADKDAKALKIEFRGLKVGDVVEHTNEVNLYDIDMILQEAVHSGDEFSENSYIVQDRRVYADANHDGKVSAADAILIFNYYMEYTETQNMLYSLYLIK